MSTFNQWNVTPSPVSTGASKTASDTQFSSDFQFILPPVWGDAFELWWDSTIQWPHFILKSTTDVSAEINGYFNPLVTPWQNGNTDIFTPTVDQEIWLWPTLTTVSGADQTLILAGADNQAQSSFELYFWSQDELIKWYTFQFCLSIQKSGGVIQDGSSIKFCALQRIYQ